MKPTSAFLCTAMLLAGALPLPAASYVFESRGPAPAGNVQTTWITNGVPDIPTGPGGNNRFNSWGVVDANNRVLMSFDLSRIRADAAGQGMVVNFVMIEILRSGWTNGWASNSLWTAAAFNPAAVTWSTGSGLDQGYIGDIGGPNAFTMTWDSRSPGPNSWDTNIDDLVPDVQGDLDNNRNSDYVLRVNVGNEWSTTIGADSFKMTVDVTMVPEPTVVPLSALALCGLALRRRR